RWLFEGAGLAPPLRSLRLGFFRGVKPSSVVASRVVPAVKDSMNQKLKEYIQSITELEESKLPSRVWQIAEDFVHDELNKAFGTDEFAEVIARWYGDQPGLLWDIIEMLR